MHRHGYQGRKLGRERGPRRALLRGLASSLVLYEAITTTEAKAKELKPLIDRLITQAKKGTLADRRRVVAALGSPLAAEKLFDETAEYYRDRTSGFTRTTRLGHRPGDAAPMVRIELIDYAPTRRPKAQRTATEAAPTAETSEAEAEVQA